MKNILNFKSQKIKTCLSGFTIFSLLICTGFNVQAVSAQTQPSAAIEKNTGILETAMGSFKFTAKICGIYKDEDFYDIEIEGPGTSPDGEKIYFELSSTANAISIKLGIDERFKSSERSLKAGKYISQELVITVTDKTVTIPAVTFIDQNGQPVKGEASLIVNCNI